MHHMDFKAAQALLLDKVVPVGTEPVPLAQCGGRILASDLTAAESIPPFDRSPYDGYAFRAADSAAASEETPVTLTILEDVPAGAVPTKAVTPGTATKILTGAPIPAGADAVTPYEWTRFDENSVTLLRSYRAGDNIVRTGEDVVAGQVLAKKGDRIDGGTAGTLAAQGETQPLVYRRLRVGILSTGNEVIEADEALRPGKIRNSNRHTLETVLTSLGFEPVYLGLAGDNVENIAALLKKGLESCDAILSTGGVSVGDYDLTPDAMERAGIEVLVRGVALKPGMACAYGVKEGKLVCGLSGNPASSMTNFYAVALPALRKAAGWHSPCYQEFDVTLLEDFRKKSPVTRLLRGTLDLTGGTVGIHLPQDQGNVVLSSTIGCNVMAIVPGGTGPVPKNTTLKGFLLV